MKKQKVNKKLLFLVAYFALFSLFQLAFSTKSVVAEIAASRNFVNGISKMAGHP